MGTQRSACVGLLAAALLVVAAPASSQQGTITGTVVDGATSQALSGALVEAVALGRSSNALTNAQGQFRLTVAPGSYRVGVEMLGYATETVEGVQVAVGATTTLQITMSTRAIEIGEIVVQTGALGTDETSFGVPGHLEVVRTERIAERAATTPADYVKPLPGVDVAQTGITQSNVVTRGFNNVFSGAMLVLTDHRYARVPSLRLNAYNMIPTTSLDIDRVEMLLGPAAALYGPNSANGVMHIITTSPIDEPGTSVSLAGGERSVFHGAFRQAFAFNERAGLKVSGQYFRGNDFEYTDSAEVAEAAADPTNPYIGNRDFGAERFGGEARLDLRPWDDGEVVFTYGLNELASSIELTGIGAGQARDWRYQFGQVRLRKGGLFAQVFRNWSHSGNDNANDTTGTYLLRTGNTIVDRSSVTAAQLQYGMVFGGRVDATLGADWIYTNPVTDSTITGSNEDNDRTTETAGYLHTRTALTDVLDLVAAFRVDKHEHLEDPVYSPRAGLVFEPEPGQSWRFTYNRAFDTPTTNNLFLDIVAGRIALTPTIGYDVRTFGVPKSGLTFDNTCPGGVQSLCMYSPFDATGSQLPANGALFWDPVIVQQVLLPNPQFQAVLAAFGVTQAEFQNAVASPGATELASVLLRFDHEGETFVADPGVEAVDRIRPTITNTFEFGYKGIVGNRLNVAADVYRSHIEDFVGPLRVETPTVFLGATSVGTYVTTRLLADGHSQTAAQTIGAAAAAGAAQVPLGTVAPDQRSSPDQILTYRNFGDIDLWGADLGFQLFATDEWSLLGSYSWVSKECLDIDENDRCTDTRDVALNAPTNKGTVGVRYDDEVTGIAVEGRARFTGDFPMNSGVYVGDVRGYTVVDLNAAYRVPGFTGLIVSLTLNNVLDKEHQEFVGAPEIGRLGLVKLQYRF